MSLAKKAGKKIVDALTLLLVALGLVRVARTQPAPAVATSTADTTASTASEQAAGQIVSETPTAPAAQIVIGDEIGALPLDPSVSSPVATVDLGVGNVVDTAHDEAIIGQPTPAGATVEDVFPLPRVIDDVPIVVDPIVVAPPTVPAAAVAAGAVSAGVAPAPVVTLPPDVAILAPAPSATVAGIVTWSARIAGSGALTIDPEIDSANLPRQLVDGPGTVGGSFDAATLSPGLHTLFVRVTDAMNRTVRTSAPFVVQAPAPAPVVIPPVVVTPAPVVVVTPAPVVSGPLAASYVAPAPDATVSGRSVPITLLVQGGVPPYTVDPKIGSPPPFADSQSTHFPLLTVAGASVTFPIDVTAQPTGTRRLSTAVTDKAGTRIVANLALTVVVPTTPVPAPPSPATGSTVPSVATTWARNMVLHAATHAAALRTMKGGALDPVLANVYYDAGRVFQQIADYTNDGQWDLAADDAIYVYRDRYVMQTIGYINSTVGNGLKPGAVQGHWNFTTGLHMDFLRHSDARSLDAVLALRQNAAGSALPMADFLRTTATFASMREMTYFLNAHLNAEAMGAAPFTALHQATLDRLFLYIDQYTTPALWGTAQVSPFMAGLLADALIAQWHVTADPRVLPALARLADFMWLDQWHQGSQGFLYQANPNCQSGDGPRRTTGSTDLNLLVAPLYAWLWTQTNDARYRDQADAIFAGGVGPGASTLYLAKQFNQNYYWSFAFMTWRYGG